MLVRVCARTHPHTHAPCQLRYSAQRGPFGHDGVAVAWRRDGEDGSQEARILRLWQIMYSLGLRFCVYNFHDS